VSSKHALTLTLSVCSEESAQITALFVASAMAISGIVVADVSK